MSELLALFEEHVGLVAQQASRLLGCPSATYYQYRRTDHMPDYFRLYVELVMRIPEDLLDDLLKERVFNDNEL